MSVYLPKAFASHDGAAALRLMSEYPFATLVTPGADEPLITHLPLLPDTASDPPRRLIGHLARANPQWQHFAAGPSTAIFHGPHAYVSPSWYAEPAAQVPTWNYAVIHVRGSVTTVDDPAAKLAILQGMVAHFESGRTAPWRLQLEGRRLDAMVDAIVAFHLSIERIDAKFKLSQNKSGEDQARLAAGLIADDSPEAIATAAWMKTYAGG